VTRQGEKRKAEINRRVPNVEPQNNEVDGKSGISFLIRNSIFVNLRFNTDRPFGRCVVALALSEAALAIAFPKEKSNEK